MLMQCQPFSTAYLLLLQYIISYNYHKKAIHCKSLSKLAFSDMECKRVRMLSVNVQAWNKRARVIIDVFLASFLASCPSWHLSKESETPFFFSIFYPKGGVNVEVSRHSLLHSFMLTVLQKGLILRCTFSSQLSFFSQKQPKGKSSNNVIPLWAPNRHGPFKTEQQNRSQRIKLLLSLLKHKLHIQWNDRVQLSEILRTFVLWSSQSVRHVDSFFRHTVCVQEIAKLTLCSMW